MQFVPISDSLFAKFHDYLKHRSEIYLSNAQELMDTDSKLAERFLLLAGEINTVALTFNKIVRAELDNLKEKEAQQ